MAESSLSLATLLGLGGVFGILAGVYAAGKKFAGHLSDFATALERALKDPRHVDLNALAEKARAVEKDAKSLLGMIKQLVKG